MKFPETSPDCARTVRQKGEPSSVRHLSVRSWVCAAWVWDLGARAFGPHRQCLTSNHRSAFRQRRAVGRAYPTILSQRQIGRNTALAAPVHSCAGLSARPRCGTWVRGPPARIVSASPRIIARRSYRSPFVQSLVRTAIEQLFCNTM